MRKLPKARSSISSGITRLFGLYVVGALSVIAQENPSKLDEEEISKNFKKPGYSPYADRNYPTKPLFGDTHLHTSVSLDAIGMGNTLGAEFAYRFARGETVTSPTGIRTRLSQPLDFVVVADHAEAYGAMIEVVEGNPQVMSDPQVKKWNKMLTAGGDQAFKAVMEMISLNGQGKLPKVLLEQKLIRDVWEKHLELTDSYNDPGRFTAFNGYEWTSMPDGNNLHRVIVFRDDKARVSQILPLSATDSDNPEDLWKFMAKYEKDTGGSAFAIPHNGNVSNGRMFEAQTFEGKPPTQAWADARMRWEPLYEVVQMKGDGEAHPFLSPDDEFADYETWDTGNITLSEAKEETMLAGEYAREAFKRGLQLEKKIGSNPFKFGLVGSTDTHTSLPTVEEENFFGKHSGKEPSAKRWSKPVVAFGDKAFHGWEQTAAGLAVVWAKENTREAIFDAMVRKETYATTGTRLKVRFFGGWDFTKEDAALRIPADAGYAKGVPMGGDLQSASQGQAPSFLVAALRDPVGGNLDRIQIVKGWMDASGKLHEKVHNVVWSDERKPDAKGKLPAVGNTVDVAKATWTNTIGASELVGVWKDPDFDASERAFYYARVIEIPTPRWTAYDAKFFKIKMSEEVPMETQDRAYTSPIWYTP